MCVCVCMCMGGKILTYNILFMILLIFGVVYVQILNIQ